MNKTRHHILRRVHLWLALPLALFLIVLGLTGTAIAWMHELDVFLNPTLLRVDVDTTRIQQKPSALLARLNELPTYAHPNMLELPETKNDVFIASYKIPDQKHARRQVMVNPYSGEIIGERNWGEIGFSRSLLMPTLFHLHRQLLADEMGRTVVSVIAILFAVIALSGLYLWWPAWRLKAWWHAITLSHIGSWARFNFRLHRTAGFYAAPIFLMLAITGIYFNKPNWIIPKPAVEKSAKQSALKVGTLSLDEILQRAQNQFPTAKITRINLPKTADAPYDIRLLQPDELRQRTGATRVRIASDGTVIKVQDPLKAKTSDWMISYFFPLHSGEIFGIAGKIFISLFGFMPLVFAISGIQIWLRRRVS